jgi:muconate cycloisomerase
MTDEMVRADRAPIAGLELFITRVPFSDIARQAMVSSANGLGMAIPAEEAWEGGDFVFLRLVDEDGVEGWGEVLLWLPETGVSPSQLVDVIEHHLSRYVLGAQPSDVRALGARLDRNVTRNEVPKGLIDLACHDLAARQLGVPVHDLLGGRGTDELPLCGLVPLVDIDTTVAICTGYVKGGYRTLRLKVGTTPAHDRDVVAAVRDAVGHEVRLRLDYNQAYRAPEAVRALRMLEPYGIDAAEQPLPVGDMLGMVTVQSQTSIPVFLHEGAFTPAEVVTLIELGGCGVLGINAERPGGLTAALSLIDYAAARGLGTIIHNQPLGLGTAHLAHLAAARFDVLGHDVELAGDVMFSQTLVTDAPRPRHGVLPVPTGPGFGVTIDRDALDDHLVAPPVAVRAATTPSNRCRDVALEGDIPAPVRETLETLETREQGGVRA